MYPVLEDNNISDKGDEMNPVPANILLATDFSARCDRALDRSLQLMKQFNAGLTILHVIEPSYEYRTFYRKRFVSSLSYAEILADKARRELDDYLQDHSDRIRILVKKGNIADTIVETASGGNCNLVVCGVARDVMVGNHRLGRTVNRLLRRSDIPLLVVTDRMVRPYSKVLVASDMTSMSGIAVRAALSMFKDQKIDILYAEKAYGAHAVDRDRAFHEEIKNNARKDFVSFIDSLSLAEHDRKRINTIIEWGKPAPLLQEFVQSSSTDLVIMGSRKRNPLALYFFESVARRIVSGLSCDALIIRTPGQ